MSFYLLILHKHKTNQVQTYTLYSKPLHTTSLKHKEKERGKPPILDLSC